MLTAASRCKSAAADLTPDAEAGQFEPCAQPVAVPGCAELWTGRQVVQHSAPTTAATHQEQRNTHVSLSVLDNAADGRNLT